MKTIFIQPIWTEMDGQNVVVLINLVGDDIKNIDGFRLAVQDHHTDWIYTELNNEDKSHTKQITFNNLIENKVYTVIGQYHTEDKWIDIDDSIMCAKKYKLNNKQDLYMLDSQKKSQKRIHGLNIGMPITDENKCIIPFENEIRLSRARSFSNICGASNDDYGISDNYIIPEKPTLQTQHLYDKNDKYIGQTGCCMANAVASATEVFSIRNTKPYKQYSVSWFYGRNGQREGYMTYGQSLNALTSFGIPPAEFVKRKDNKTYYPDIENFANSKAMYQLTGDIPKYSLPQKILDYTFYTVNQSFEIYASDVRRICSALKSKGKTVITTITVDSSFDDASWNGTGIVGEFQDDIRCGHAMLVVGWKTIGGEKYWIVQNSWQDFWDGMNRSNSIPYAGDNGLFYIPFRWGTFEFKGSYWEARGLEGFYVLEEDPNAPDFPIPSESSLSVGDIKNTSATWTISNLDNAFNTTYYKRVGITNNQFTEEADSISGIVDYVDAPTSNSSQSVSHTITSLGLGTRYEFWGFAQAANGRYYPMKGIKNVIFTTLSAVGEFKWEYAGYDGYDLKTGIRKKQGYGFHVTAKEWNCLVKNIRQKLETRGLYSESSYQLNDALAESGEDFYAHKFNLVRFAIGSLNPTGLNDKHTGDDIVANELNLLMDKVNEIP